MITYEREKGINVIIKPKCKGFICTTAHPDGCWRSVQEQIAYVKAQPPVQGPKHVLVIGASTGYGLASRIAATFGSGAKTLGIFFERPAAGNKTATAGWYNSAAFEAEAQAAGYYAKSINGDAFSQAVKEEAINLIKADFGQVDLVIYSLAAPRRSHPVTGETLSSVIKPIGSAFASKTVDIHEAHIGDIVVEPANEEEIRQTIGVMGGEDWAMWIDALLAAGVLAEGARTVSYSYIGPKVTHAIYRDGTIGRAKEHLEASAASIQQKMTAIQGQAFVSVNKALVTQASTAIPGMALYMSLLFKVMKEKGLHEHCIEQICRLFADRLYADTVPVDIDGRIRLDDWEMREDVQAEVYQLWQQVTSDNITALSDVASYRDDFFRLFGFGFAGVDYEADTEAQREIASIAAR